MNWKSLFFPSFFIFTCGNAPGVLPRLPWRQSLYNLYIALAFCPLVVANSCCSTLEGAFKAPDHLRTCASTDVADKQRNHLLRKEYCQDGALQNVAAGPLRPPRRAHVHVLDSTDKAPPHQHSFQQFDNHQTNRRFPEAARFVLLASENSRCDRFPRSDLDGRFL